MSDEYADAVVRLEDDLDRAISRALDVLSVKEIVAELRNAIVQLENPA